MSYTANFRRFHPSRSFRKEELALIESLERQRHRTGHVRAVINDPAGKFTESLISYISYIRHLSKRDALIVASCRCEAKPNPHAISVSHRSYLRILGTRRPIGQLLLLDSHVAPRLDAILQIALPYVAGPNSVIIIHGSTKTAKPTRFQHWLNLAADPQSIYYRPKFVPVQAARGENPRRAVVQWRPKLRPHLPHQISPQSLPPANPFSPFAPQKIAA